MSDLRSFYSFTYLTLPYQYYAALFCKIGNDSVGGNEREKVKASTYVVESDSDTAMMSPLSAHTKPRTKPNPLIVLDLDTYIQLASEPCQLKSSELRC